MESRFLTQAAWIVVSMLFNRIQIGVSVRFSGVRFRFRL